MNRTRRSILVVDDDADIRGVLAEVLHEHGYPVVQACNGQDALARLLGDASLMPGLILLDGRMPVMTGPELMQRLRLDERLRQIPVVLLSADGRVRNASGRADPLETVTTLSKPVQLDDLLAVAAKFCDGPQA